eukprot:6186078-Pleurochrysis_carterae.AAC.2
MRIAFIGCRPARATGTELCLGNQFWWDCQGCSPAKSVRRVSSSQPHGLPTWCEHDLLLPSVYSRSGPYPPWFTIGQSELDGRAWHEAFPQSTSILQTLVKAAAAS